MYCSNCTYCSTILNATFSGTFVGFVFTGKERDEETGYGYFGARYMDHELMTGWLSVDPMADKYPSMSPYNYCAWNPVKLVDLDGREFDPSSKIFVDDYKKAINDKLGEMYTTKEDIEQLRSALAEIAVLESSDQMYRITNIGSTYVREKGGTFYNSDDNSIGIEFDGKIANLAHELKHAYQFHEGKLSFNKSGEGFGVLYDKTDEVEALTRGGIFDKKQLETLRNIDYVYKFKVKKNDKGIDYHYPFLDKRPNPHSTVGHRSSSRTVSNANELNLDLTSDYYRTR